MCVTAARVTSRANVSFGGEPRAGRSGDRIPVGIKIFRTRPDWFLYYTRGAGTLPGVRRSGRDGEVKERVELKLYTPSGSSWLVNGVNSTFYLILCPV